MDKNHHSPSPSQACIYLNIQVYDGISYYCIYLYMQVYAKNILYKNITFSIPGAQFHDVSVSTNTYPMQCKNHIVRSKVKKHSIIGVYTDFKKCYFHNWIYEYILLSA